MSESPALRILVITSRPLVTVEPTQENGELTFIRHPIALKPLRHVRQELERALKGMGGPVAVRYLARATTAAVQTALLDSYDVVHFIGHGADDGRLLLEQENAVADLLSVERAAQMLHSSQARLIVISACHSGKAAQALRQAGIANVVAIDEQLPITDRAAALFNQLFYGGLVRGRSLSEAFLLGVDAVQADNEVGDHRPPLHEKTGAELPLWSSRFSPFFADDRPLAASAGHGQYEELDAWTVPTNLPHNPEIVGREALMVDAIKALADARLVTLTGPGGIGKTTIAEEVARWHAERELFHDGVFFVSLEGIKDAVRLAETMARALNVTPDPTNPVGSLQAALTRREVLLLLDNAETLLEEPIEDASSAVGVLGALLEAAPGLKLIVTSREALGLRRWEQQLAIDEMAQGEAERLFLNYAPAEQRLELALAHRVTIQEICRTLEHYPLALVLAAPQLSEAGMAPERLLRDLKAKMLEVLEDEGSRGVPKRLRSLRASLDLSYQRLSGRARIVLFYLGVLPGGASGRILANLVGKRFEPAAQELVERNLARWQDGRYTMLAPIRTYAVATRPAKRLATTRLRAARLYAQLADSMDELLKPLSRRRIAEQLVERAKGQSLEETERRLTRVALAVFDAERTNLLASVEWVFAEQAWVAVRTLVDKLNTYLHLRSFWGDMVVVGQTAVTAAKQESNRTAEDIALNNLGVVYQSQSRWAEAITAYEQSLVIFRELGDRHGEGQTLNNLGVVYQSQSRWAEAITAHEQSLVIFHELGDRHGEGQTLGNLGNVYQSQSRWAEAIAACEQSLAILVEIGDYSGVIPVSRQLGWIRHSRGELDAACEHFVHAFALACDLHSKLVADTLSQIIALAKEVATSREMTKVSQLGQRMLEVTEQRSKQGWKGEELQAMGVLCQQVFTVMALLGLSADLPPKERKKARTQVLESAKGIDKITQGKWELESWVKASTGRRSAKAEEKGSRAKKKGGAEPAGEVP
ncbi:MAG: tetratricopeptide repeat protein [Deltaproteobacteria bacterium]|nr:tetratricopeptide repeat protein [Deltaproteobacteria bacterium]